MSLQNTNYGKDRISELLCNSKSIYFLGIGGISMSSLARMTVAHGVKAGGYDRNKTAITEKLEKDGIPVFYELDPNHVEGYDAVVYTVAISEDNAEYLHAIELGIPIISRADYLGYIMCAYEHRIGVSGMHGKSTTTAMVANIFEAADKNPTVLSGAELKGIGSPYRSGGLENFIFEACEYKDSFLEFYPQVALVLNIDLDHLDYFSGIDHIKSSFSKFIEKCGDDGVAVLNYDDKNVRDIADTFSGKIVSFGINSEDVDYRAINIKYSDRSTDFDILFTGNLFCHITLSVTGEHYIKDALGAVAAAASCGVTADAIKMGLRNFVGVRRRMDYKGKFAGADVYDDYAHHPAEIKTTIDGAKKMGYSKLWCVYQPHTYSRTASLYDKFVAVFKESNINIVFADIYAARETNEWGVSSEQLAKDIPGAVYFSNYKEITDYLQKNVGQNDAILVMGAGDIYCIFEEMDL